MTTCACRNENANEGLVIMFRSSATRWIIGVIAVIAALGLLRYKPWQRGAQQTADSGNEARERLNVGFLPVT